ncbi:MAG: folylpolyglutamate synthase/dihydrofolate synthase family protein [Sandaracinaceae bacterium]
MPTAPPTEPPGYRAMLEELYDRARRGISPGLDRMHAALDALDHPEASFDVVHVAGTNGKGSVSAMLHAGLRESALYTSPHLHSLTERFVVGDRPIAHAALVDAWASIRDRIAHVPLTFFEAATLLAFTVFARERVEVAVLEVGLGGRLDATNVFDAPRLTVITRVGMDHTAILGSDLASIAREKAGILKRGAPLVLGAQLPEAKGAILARASELDVEVIEPVVVSRAPFVIEIDGAARSLSQPTLSGAHQYENAAVAVAALIRMGADDDALTRAMAARWPGRLETIGDVLLDAAHNPDGARALAAALAAEATRRTLVFGAMRDKAHDEMLAILRPFVGQVVLTQVPMERAAPPDELGEPDDVRAPDVPSALALARSLGAPIVVAGSIFVMAQARAQLLGIAADPLIAM